MKRILLLTFLLTVIFSTVAFAKPGDVAGSIYSTDIKAYINGIEVPSYNIGGKTAVIIEDITSYYEYNDSLRALIFWGLEPYALVEGKNEQTLKPGKKICNIYETDIKTYIRSKNIPAFSLNGKMAVAIEDLGDDGEFSDIGGKYIWNEKERSLSLEFLYFYSGNVHQSLMEKNLNMILTEEKGKIVASFESSPIINGSISGGGILENNTMKPIYIGDEIVGYRYKFSSIVFECDENGEYSLTENSDTILGSYFYDEKVAEHIKDIPKILPTYDDWIEYYKFTGQTVLNSLDTEDYTFFHLSQGTPHGSTQYLRKVNKGDGTVIAYDDSFKSVSLHGQKGFDNLTIDEENKKVYFRYDKDYVIDLETNEINEVK